MENKKYANASSALDGAATKINKGADLVKANKTVSTNVETSDLKKWVEFVNKNQLAFSVGGKNYLRVEAWNRLFSIYKMYPSVSEVTTASFTRDGEEETVFLAKACLVKDGVAIAEAVGACRVGESNYSSDYYSAISMAQTRAIGKLGRTVFGHVAIAGGFQATPLEEIPTEGKDGE